METNKSATSAVVPDQLRAFCRGHLANDKVPQSVAFVDAFPISGAGKILKRELRTQHWDDDGKSSLAKDGGSATSNPIK